MITFHQILPACEQGSHEAWQAFLSDYTPIVFQLFDIYLPSRHNERRQEFWLGALHTLTANNFELLRTFDQQAEREFLVELRAFVFERAAARVDPSDDTPGSPSPTAERVSALLNGLPLLHQEILFLKLAGYSNATLEKLLKIPPAVAQRGLERLQADYSIALRRDRDAGLWPATWSEVLQHARTAKKQGCPPLRQLVLIADGHVSWYDKAPVEEHMSSCLHCLERWTALREVVHWRREATPRPTAELEALLSSLPVATRRKRQRSLLQRMLRY